jgi:LPXTG-motif cell wall-anchored protein
VERLGDQRLNADRRRERGKGMRKVTARVLTLALVVVAAMAIPGVARADSFEWGGQGADNLPCPFGAHWVLTGQGIESATLTVDGESIEMTQSGNQGSFSVDFTQPVDESSDVSVEFEPEGAANVLTLSHCLEGETTTTTTSEGGGPGTPETGFNPLPFVALGLVLLAGGAFVLRRRIV